MPDANAQTLILERDLKNLGDRISDNVHRLDRHLEIYSQNGKELAALKSAVSSLQQSFEKNLDSHKGEHEKLWTTHTAMSNEVNELKINVSSLAMKIGLYASLGSAAATAVVLFMVDKILAL